MGGSVDAGKFQTAPGQDLIVIYSRSPMHVFWLFVVWMVYGILAMGVLEAYSERDSRLVRGAATAMVVGGVVSVALSVVILWFGPIDPW